MQFIYSLSNPTTNEIRYIGKTNNLKNRFKGHLKEIKSKRNSYKINWIRSLKSQGLEPIIELLDEGNLDNCKNKK